MSRIPAMHQTKNHNAPFSLQWRQSECDGVSNHQPRNFLFRLSSEKTSKLRVIGLCAGNSPMTVEFPEQRASNAEDVSIWWRHHGNRNVRTYTFQNGALWTMRQGHCGICEMRLLHSSSTYSFKFPTFVTMYLPHNKSSAFCIKRNI